MCHRWTYSRNIHNIIIAINIHTCPNRGLCVITNPPEGGNIRHNIIMSLTFKMLSVAIVIFVLYLLAPKGYLTWWPTLMPFNQKEAQEVLERTKNRNMNEVSMFHQSDPGVHKVFAYILNRSELEVRMVSIRQNIFLFVLKYLFNRPRPYQVIPEIKKHMLESKTGDTPAYPAGHTYQAFLVAKHYSKKYPHMEQLLMRTADSIGQSRIAAGIHYHSDHAISKKLALILG